MCYYSENLCGFTHLEYDYKSNVLLFLTILAEEELADGYEVPSATVDIFASAHDETGLAGTQSRGKSGGLPGQRTHLYSHCE